MLSTVDAEKAPLASIFGLSGAKLTKDERSFFAEANPLGFILFARNCDDPAQLKALTGSLHDCMGREVPVLIDQEGGRVQRLKSPHWQDYPAAQEFGNRFTRNFSEGIQDVVGTTSSMAQELTDSGISVNCAPVLDVMYPETHASIGDRAFSNDPEMVAVLGAQVCRTYLQGGIIPVIKHMPGQGRAESDSHEDLPVIETALEDMEKTDFLPFKEMLTKSFSEAIWGMVAHVIYRKIDARAPASCSRRVIWDVIRQKIGFQGLLLSDDISMEALKDYGDAGQRAEKMLRAGCDVALHCNGDRADMELIAGRMQKMTNESVLRYNRSVSWVNRNLK